MRNKRVEASNEAIPRYAQDDTAILADALQVVDVPRFTHPIPRYARNDLGRLVPPYRLTALPPYRLTALPSVFAAYTESRICWKTFTGKAPSISPPSI